jgi:hypothetical protein
MAEMRGFVFSLIFIIVFSTILSSIPVGFLGTGASPETVIPIDPSLLSGFDETQNYTKSAFTGTVKTYAYSLGSRDWNCLWVDLTDDVFSLTALVYVFGFLWLGQTDPCKFLSPDGVNRGTTLAVSAIAEDAEDGTVRYSMLFTTTGEDAGSFLVYWNTTQYTDPQDAMDNDALYLLHGIGFSLTATTNIGALLVGLLFLQLPNIPVLVNMFIVVPIWACIVYVLWYVIKEMIPFV